MRTRFFWGKVVTVCLGISLLEEGTPFVLATEPIVTLLNKSLSATQARDGQTIRFGYRIRSSQATTCRLGAILMGPPGSPLSVIEDAAHEVSIPIIADTRWYYRDFVVTAPPQADTGPCDVKWTIYWGKTGQDSLAEPGGLTIQLSIPVRLLILLYHKVGPTAYDEEWATTTEFAAQLKALKAYGYTPVTLQDAMDYRAGVSTPPAKPVVITFDDGFENLLTDAYPVLADPEIDFKATGFIITGYVGQTNAWEGTDPVLNYLTWDQIQALQASGRLDFQSHTVSHPNLVNYPPAALPDQLLDSRQDLETHLGTAVRFIAWPYGAYNTTVAQAAWAAGYQAGVLAAGGIETGSATQRTELKRIEIFATTSVNYDPIHRDNFFMTKIQEPDFPVPAISLSSIQYLHPVTGLPVSVVRQGSPVTVRVTAANAGAEAPVAASLMIDDDANPANGLIYDSHALSPSEDIVRTFVPGTRTFAWTVTVPLSARTSIAAIRVTFHDPYYVLRFAQSEWLTGFTIIEGPPGVTGTVVLDNYPPGPNGVSVTVELRKSGGTRTVFTPILDASGRFSLVPITPGTYEVWIKASHWLAKRIGGVTVTGGRDIGTVHLINGDANGDNVITFEDFSIIQNRYGQSVASNTNGDVTGNGRVTFADFAILQNNYGRRGDK